MKTKFLLLTGVILLVMLVTRVMFWKTDDVKAPAQKPDGLSLLETFDCRLPCLLGVTVEQTNYQDALNIASIHASTPPPVDGVYDICKNDQCIRLEIRPIYPTYGDAVGSITLIPDYPRIITTLDELLDRGYTPQRVFRGELGGPNDTFGLTILFTGDTNIIASVVGIGEIGPNSRIDYLILAADQEVDARLSSISGLSDTHRYVEIPWIGYASKEEYDNLPPFQPE
jgi:hypothetical protein